MITKRGITEYRCCNRRFCHIIAMLDETMTYASTEVVGEVDAGHGEAA
jgi:hypothetical protein